MVYFNTFFISFEKGSLVRERNLQLMKFKGVSKKIFKLTTALIMICLLGKITVFTPCIFSQPGTGLFTRLKLPEVNINKEPAFFNGHEDGWEVNSKMLSPDLKIDEDFKFGFGLACYHYRKLQPHLAMLKESLAGVETAYQAGINAYIRGNFSLLLSRVIWLQNENMRVWRVGLLYNLHPFLWEFEKNGRTPETDRKLDAIHEGVEKILDKTIPKLYVSNFKKDMAFSIQQSI